MDEPQRVGVAGLGAMGSGMASRLLDCGRDLVVWNRTAERAAPLTARGAAVAASPAELAARADVVLVSLADQAAVEDVLFGDDGLLAGLGPGGAVAETSTVSPEYALAATERAASLGIDLLDARVVGNGRHAAQGELRFLVGGPDELVARLRPLLEDLGKEVLHLGSSGQAATMKLLLNMLMGVELQALAEAFAFGQRAGLPADLVHRAVSASGFSSPVMRFKGEVMRRRAFDPPDFRLSLMRKDLALLRGEAQRLGAVLPACDASYAVLTAAVHAGLGDLDCAAVLRQVHGMSGVVEEG